LFDNGYTRICNIKSDFSLAGIRPGSALEGLPAGIMFFLSFSRKLIVNFLLASMISNPCQMAFSTMAAHISRGIKVLLTFDFQSAY
jgi:hypothetical protein